MGKTKRLHQRLRTYVIIILTAMAVFPLLASAAFPAAAGVKPVKGGPEIAGYECLYYPIPYDKLGDSIWDCAAGPDGRIYIGMCSEHSGGSAHLLAFDPATETFEDVFDAQSLTRSPIDRKSVV